MGIEATVRAAGMLVVWVLLLDLANSTVDEWSWTAAIFWGAVFCFIGPWINPFNRSN